MATLGIRHLIRYFQPECKSHPLMLPKSSSASTSPFLITAAVAILLFLFIFCMLFLNALLLPVFQFYWVLVSSFLYCQTLLWIGFLQTLYQTAVYNHHVTMRSIVLSVYPFDDSILKKAIPIPQTIFFFKQIYQVFWEKKLCEGGWVRA